MRLIQKIKALLNPKSPELKSLETRIQYSFGNTYYLEKAITHRSVQNHSLGNYERLEFVGDAVIDQAISLWLFKRYPESDEGKLTKKRSTLVNREFLGIMGKNIQIMDVVRIDPSVNITDPKIATKIAADIYEAIVGAIYLDGGYHEASNFIKRTLCAYEHLADEVQNFKGRLIE